MLHSEKDDESSVGTGHDGAGRSCCGRGWRLPLLLALVLAAVLLLNRFGVRQSVLPGEARLPSGAADDAASSQSVGLVVDFGDGTRRTWDAVVWHEGMTVADALAAAAASPESKLELAQRGSGASALLTRINNLASEGSSGRNWLYEVNGQRADRSFAVYLLRPGDQVLWKFSGPR